MSAAARILGHLSNVRQTGFDRWIASCPTAAHRRGDRSRGLSIREADGRVLIYCHAGCGAGEIVEALGLSLGDLYDQPLTRETLRLTSHSTIPARDLLLIVDHELTVVVLILDEITTRRTVNEGQVQRLCQASARIGKARDMANPAKVVPSAA